MQLKQHKGTHIIILVGSRLYEKKPLSKTVSYVENGNIMRKSNYILFWLIFVARIRAISRIYVLRIGRNTNKTKIVAKVTRRIQASIAR